VISFGNFNTPVDKNWIFLGDFNLSWRLLLEKYKSFERKGLIELVKKGNCNFDNYVISYPDTVGKGREEISEL
jgi:hypothetical protein